MIINRGLLLKLTHHPYIGYTARLCSQAPNDWDKSNIDVFTMQLEVDIKMPIMKECTVTQTVEHL
jgi:hypothetical protein